MEQMLKEAGYTIVPFDGECIADVYVINTCSVTNIADRKSRQMLHKAKKINPDAIVIATGCYAQEAGKELAHDDAVDLVIGNNQKKNLIDIIAQYRGDANKNNAIDDLTHETQYETLSIQEVSDHTRAYIKVQDGCNQFCSYCIIPYLRGRVRSRLPEDVISEITGLAQKGYKEFVLTGIHLSSYGVDFKEERKITLLDLVKKISLVEGVKRIRLGSLEPRVVTEEFASELAKIEKICPHFHLSLQSGCDTTLKRMNRKYSTNEYKESCDILRKYFKNVAVTTDVIVGFPQESEEEFECTKTFLELIHFYEMHVFKYSRRKGTVADRMDGQVDDSIKAKRSNELLELERRMSAEYRLKQIGKAEEVLFEEIVDGDDKNGFVTIVGHTKTYVKVFANVEKNCAVKMINEIFEVELTSLTDDKEAVFGIVKK